MIATILTVLAAIVFVGAGLFKLTTPRDKFVAANAWAESVPDLGVRALGLAQLAGAFGLLMARFDWTFLGEFARRASEFALPALGLVMIGAILTHVVRKDSFDMMKPAIGIFVLLSLIGFLY